MIQRQLIPPLRPGEVCYLDPSEHPYRIASHYGDGARYMHFSSARLALQVGSALNWEILDLWQPGRTGYINICEGQGALKDEYRALLRNGREAA